MHGTGSEDGQTTGGKVILKLAYVRTSVVAALEGMERKLGSVCSEGNTGFERPTNFLGPSFQNHKIMELYNGLSWKGHLPLEQAAPSPVQPGLWKKG